MAYAKRNVREGLLGRMLTELLDTRIMVKQVRIAIFDSMYWLSPASIQAMKSAKGDRVCWSHGLRDYPHSRQHANAFRRVYSKF